uniref:Large ribosomal subunit protein bL21c n=1 Tax=Verdigellas peltata TaxID=542676 RepID=A0A170TNJ3_9VIRI|nr:ribosomal protein L21 [Verdigellas peltata]CZF96662.1 ribosomal protein L21 [Verdigellas peltata]
MTYAIIETGGHQLFIKPGNFYNIKNFPKTKSNTKLIFNRVLFFNSNNEIFIGQPFIKNIIVEARIIKNFKASKIIVYKMRRKKKTRRKYGQRQSLIQVFIEKIKLNKI